MRDEFRPTLSNTVAGDLASFCATMSRCTGLDLRAGRDPLVLYRPADQRDRNARGYMVMCEVAGQLVVLKRCADNPEYMRRELAVAAIKSAIGWEPSYPVVPVGGIALREVPGMLNCGPLRGWGGRRALAIGAGPAGGARNMLELEARDVESAGAFYHALGRWSAFNYLVGVRDRHPRNFIFFPGTQELHSIDNEEGPFDPSGANIGTYENVNTMRLLIAALSAPGRIPLDAGRFRAGFASGWGAVRSGGRAVLGPLDARERGYVGRLLGRDPDAVCGSFLRP